MKFNKYNIQARIAPAVIVLVPFLIFTINCDIEGLSVFFNDLMQVRIIGNVTISTVLLFLFYQINRSLGKLMFEKSIFKNEMEMPTTKYLMFTDNTFTGSYKLKIRDKIKMDFDIDLLNEQEELNVPDEAKKRIVEAVGLVRNKVKNGHLLLQYNIEYGFWRNLIGGALIGFFVSIVDILYFIYQDKLLVVWISFVFAFFFFMLFIVRKSLINNFGILYAKRFYQEYLS